MRKALNYFTPLFLCWIYIIPLMQLLADTFGLPVSAMLTVHLLVLCTLLWVARCFAKPAIFAALGCVVYLCCVLLMSDDSIIAQAAELIDRIGRTYTLRYSSVVLTLTGGEGAEDVTFAASLLGFLIACVVMGTLTASSARISAVILSTVPFFAAAICVTGTPAQWQIVMLLVFWALVFATGPSFMPEQDSSGKVLAVLIVPVTALICILLFLVEPKSYNYDRDVSDWERRLESFGERIAQALDIVDVTTVAEDAPSKSGGMKEPEVSYTPGMRWGSGDGSLDLRCERDDIDDSVVIMTVKAETSGYMYLRSISFGDYTGTGWMSAEDAPLSSAGFAARAVKNSSNASEHNVVIELEAASRELAHLPYFTDTDGCDYCADNPGTDAYTVDYAAFSGDVSTLSVPDDMSGDELIYREYAHDVFTALPDAAAAQLLEIAEHSGIQRDDPGVINSIAGLVQSRVEYSLDTAPYPTEDFAVYFFTQAESGYCVHYATAACAMYRALGIPARVVDGFLAETRAGRRCDVTAQQEHAWVEVYFDGIGWIPVEVTGSYGEGQAQQEQDTPEDVLAASQETDTHQPETAPVIETPAPAESSAPAMSVGIVTNEESESAPKLTVLAVILRALVIILIIILTVFAVFSKRYADVALRRRSFYQNDRKKAAIAVYKYAKRLEAYGGTMPEFIEINAEKAFYSLHDISPVEMRCALEMAESMAEETYSSLDKKQRFMFKYVYGLI